MSQAAEQPASRLADALLRAPAAEDPSDEPWAYRGWAALLVSLFILYHTVALLQHTTPAAGLAERFNRKLAGFLRAGAYMRATSSVQSWAMFAPNPHRTNQFLQVRVVTQDGEELDLLHDIYGRRDYPYFFYDRMGKINRRLLEQERYQSPYAAWVCREWARTHGGEAPVRINFTKMWTKVPPPDKAIATMGFDPFALKLYKEPLKGFDCATTPHAQLPNDIRARYGFTPLPDGAFVDIEENTWRDRADAKARILQRRRAADAGRGKAPAGKAARGEDAAPPAEGGAEGAPGEGGGAEGAPGDEPALANEGGNEGGGADGGGD
ncbi:hypothetical protein OV079_37800 [Nannocystis pusilla]|uniref:Uncharacterized protein n=1 Tax=Nannocystis pusilla TaxID=889268 RepID=A0A9X3J2L2_9BACT|nr:hypothetical protein [Nannocystis pusilla]MCY1011218.1 hypothetical protein [Nannocystis pusilla]